MNKVTEMKNSLVLAVLLLPVYAQAAVGAKIKTAIRNAGTELMIVGGALLFIAIVLLAINMFWTPINHIKRWVGGIFAGGVLLVFAEDIADTILKLSGSGAGF